MKEIITDYLFLCVIFAGIHAAAYAILKNNPGLKARIKDIITRNTDKPQNEATVKTPEEENVLKEEPAPDIEPTAPAGGEGRYYNKEEDSRILPLKVGDRYYCVLNTIERNEVGMAAGWKSTNPFVAEIDENSGQMNARHVGSCNIESGEKGYVHTIYKVVVKERNSGWKASKEFDAIALRDTGIDQMRLLNIGRRRLFCIDHEARTTIYTDELSTDLLRIMYEHDEENRLVRALLEFNNREETKDEILREMDERMERTRKEKPENEPARWYYMKDCEEDFVNAVAFMKLSHHGTILLGIGKTWRGGAESEEICNNEQMIERTFARLLDQKDIPQTIRTTEEAAPAEAPAPPVKEETGNDTPEESKPDEDALNDAKESTESPKSFEEALKTYSSKNYNETESEDYITDGDDDEQNEEPDDFTENGGGPEDGQ